jgi:ubiquitin-like modifier-activating enzyme ATG7
MKMRGYLHSYSIILPTSQSFDKCTACSNSVIEMYNKDGFDFLLKVFNDSAYLEDITGLKDLKISLDENEPEFVIELSDNESI